MARANRALKFSTKLVSFGDGCVALGEKGVCDARLASSGLTSLSHSLASAVPLCAQVVALRLKLGDACSQLNRPREVRVTLRGHAYKLGARLVSLIRGGVAEQPRVYKLAPRVYELVA